VTDQSSETNVIERGAHAARLLGDEVLAAAIAEVERVAFEAFKVALTPEAAIAAQIPVRGVGALVDALHGMKNRGDLAAHARDQERRTPPARKTR
jgi:hypothetical protein